MDGPELRSALAALGWSRCELAARWGGSEGLVRRMEAGVRPIEPALAAWLRRAVAWHAAHPVPRHGGS